VDFSLLGCGQRAAEDCRYFKSTWKVCVALTCGCEVWTWCEVLATRVIHFFPHNADYGNKAVEKDKLHRNSEYRVADGLLFVSCTVWLSAVMSTLMQQTYVYVVT
jgi:hypothetical protein